jgi:GNAT superfamily N-acetyltransferase
MPMQEMMAATPRPALPVGASEGLDGLMSSPFQIRPARSAADLQAVAALFTAYATSLPIELSYQDFEAELAGLPGKYAPPRGEVFLARDLDGVPIGCAAMRPLDDGVGEMKRLFLRPEARGLGLGRALTQAVIEQARTVGYGELKLDTLASMDAALALYEQMGFERTAAYYAPTPAGTIFLRLHL